MNIRTSTIGSMCAEEKRMRELRMVVHFFVCLSLYVYCRLQCSHIDSSTKRRTNKLYSAERALQSIKLSLYVGGVGYRGIDRDRSFASKLLSPRNIITSKQQAGKVHVMRKHIIDHYVSLCLYKGFHRPIPISFTNAKKRVSVLTAR